jgi:CspA family cold shock protein
MGKGRDRGPRRRGFDDDFYAPPPARKERPQQQSFQRAPRETPAPSGPAIDAIVKWFAPDKGFGFVELAAGSGDAFLHVAVLQAAGREAVEPEAKLSVQVGQGQKGRQVTAVLSVEASAGGASRPPARPSPRPSSDRRERPDPATAVEIRLWDLESGTEVDRLEGHTHHITALALISDTILASGSAEKTIRLWDVRTSDEVHYFRLGAAVLSLAAIHGGRLVGGGREGAAKWARAVVRGSRRNALNPGMRPTRLQSPSSPTAGAKGRGDPMALSSPRHPRRVLCKGAHGVLFHR